MQGGSVYMKDLIIDQGSYTGVNVLSNSGASSNSEYLVIDGCDIRRLAKIFFSSASGVNYGVENIIIVDSKIGFGAKVTLFSVNSTVTDAKDYKRIVFRNNVVYSCSDGTNYAGGVFAFNSKTADEPNDQMVAEVYNNLFYNVATSSGLFKGYRFGEVKASKNLLWAVDGSNAGGNSKLIAHSPDTKQSVIVGTAVTDNIAYGTLAPKDGNPCNWVTADSAVIGDMEPLTVLTEENNPIVSFDAATGSYVMAPGYTSYGPQL